MINNMTNQDSVTTESVMRVWNLAACLMIFYMMKNYSVSEQVLPPAMNIIEAHDSLYISKYAEQRNIQQ